jgi:hypothetical protein
MLRMMNCPKCGKVVEHPVKTWKIKQTPIALYECPLCKAKWRRKYSEELTIASEVAIQETVQVTQKPSPLTEKIVREIPSAGVTTTTDKNSNEEAKPVSLFASIKTFFSNLFSWLTSLFARKE